MPDKDNWDVIYANCFKNQPEGHALYKKWSRTQLKPGTCGYFDEQGDWQQIEDLTIGSGPHIDDSNAGTERQKKPYTAVAGIRRVDDPLGEKWFLRKSENVHRLDAGALANMMAPGLPVGGGSTIGYSTSTGKGAVLVTSGLVKHTQSPPDSISKMYEWMRINSDLVLENYPDAKGKGLWLVTKTYTVKTRSLALLLEKESAVTLSVSAFADQENGVVLSIDGIYWEDNWYSSKIKPVTKRRKQKFLSGKLGDLVLQPIDFAMQDDRSSGMSTVELVPEIKGKIKGIRLFDPDRDERREEEAEDEGDEDED